MMRLEGKTEAGRRVSISAPIGRHSVVWIDGEQAEIKDYSLRRDGGTQIFTTDRGTVILGRRSTEPPIDILDGEQLEPLEGGQ